jgi:predicted component of type VI protein secretion system
MGQLILELRGRQIGQATLEHSENHIGRDPECQLFIDNPGISRSHAIVRWTGSHFLLEDRGSSNGTYVRGQRVSTHELRDGDEFQIGKYVVRYLESAEPQATADAQAPAGVQPARRGSRPRNPIGTMELSAEQVQRMVQNRTAAAGANASPPAAEAVPGASSPLRTVAWSLLVVALLTAGIASYLVFAPG